MNHGRKTLLIGVVFVMIYAFKVHWTIAPAFLITVPLLGWISAVLSRRIKKIQKTIVAETTALAGSTTESLRNIELVKSLGLAHQRVRRLNGNYRENPQAEPSVAVEVSYPCENSTIFKLSRMLATHGTP